MAFAKSDNRVQVSELFNDTKINGERFNVRPMDVYTINNQAYYPIRELCKDLNMEIMWDESKKEINIQTKQESKTDMGFQINKDTAVKIADALFTAEFGSEFMKEYSLVSVRDACNGKCFYVTRAIDDNTDGGGCSFVIDKSNGRIISFLIEA